MLTASVDAVDGVDVSTRGHAAFLARGLFDLFVAVVSINEDCKMRVGCMGSSVDVSAEVDGAESCGLAAVGVLAVVMVGDNQEMSE